MIDHIKEEIAKTYNLNNTKGIFMSAFDGQNNLILSNGVLMTDKPLDKVIEMIYHGLIEKHNETHKILCDIVMNVSQKTTLDEMNAINLTTEGLCIQAIDNSKSGVLLPGTHGITNIQQAFSVIKEKNSITGNINIYAFSTKRIAIQ